MSGAPRGTRQAAGQEEAQDVSHRREVVAGSGRPPSSARNHHEILFVEKGLNPVRVVRRAAMAAAERWTLPRNQEAGNGIENCLMHLSQG